jgi:hypothetical protein
MARKVTIYPNTGDERERNIWMNEVCRELNAKINVGSSATISAAGTTQEHLDA